MPFDQWRQIEGALHPSIAGVADLELLGRGHHADPVEVSVTPLIGSSRGEVVVLEELPEVGFEDTVDGDRHPLDIDGAEGDGALTAARQDGTGLGKRQLRLTVRKSKALAVISLHRGVPTARNAVSHKDRVVHLALERSGHH